MMQMNPVRAIMPNRVGRQTDLAFLIGSGRSIAMDRGMRYRPSIAQRRINHGTPCVTITSCAHGGVGLLDQCQDAGGILDSCRPSVRVSRRQMARQTFDKGAIFHDVRTRVTGDRSAIASRWTDRRAVMGCGGMESVRLSRTIAKTATTGAVFRSTSRLSAFFTDVCQVGGCCMAMPMSFQGDYL